MFFDDEIGVGWCLGAAWRCTPAEAMGLWMITLSYTTMLVVTFVHRCLQDGTAAKRRNVETRPQMYAGDKAFDSDWITAGFLLVYFFSFAAGSVLWARSCGSALGPRTRSRARRFS